MGYRKTILFIARKKRQRPSNTTTISSYFKDATDAKEALANQPTEPVSVRQVFDLDYFRADLAGIRLIQAHFILK